jgi:urea transport system substrate-binding protein
VELLHESSKRRRTSRSSKEWQAFIKDDKRVTNDPMEAHYIGFNMWVEAVKKAGTTDPMRWVKPSSA